MRRILLTVLGVAAVVAAVVCTVLAVTCPEHILFYSCMAVASIVVCWFCPTK